MAHLRHSFKGEIHREIQSDLEQGHRVHRLLVSHHYALDIHLHFSREVGRTCWWVGVCLCGVVCVLGVCGARGERKKEKVCMFVCGCLCMHVCVCVCMHACLRVC